jgi:hypothetical protein
MTAPTERQVRLRQFQKDLTELQEKYFDLMDVDKPKDFESLELAFSNFYWLISRELQKEGLANKNKKEVTNE